MSLSGKACLLHPEIIVKKFIKKEYHNKTDKKTDKPLLVFCSAKI
jgi:hypothetical protein